MSLLGSQEGGDSSSKQQFYCRKEKSLGLLCSNFLKLYNCDGTETIGLDEAASRLGVERRRIYDVVNILESIGVVARKGKNQYSWKGFDAIPLAMEKLKEEGLRERFSISTCRSYPEESNEAENGESSDAKIDTEDNPSGPKTENRKEKSLALLTQNFIKLFLCTNVDLLPLDNAAMALLGDPNNSTAMRTKVRRLYDIANVLNSMNLIEKTHHPDTRKPAFRWLGWRGGRGKAHPNAELNESKKRAFGTDITNYSKKNRMDSLTDQKLSKEVVKSIPITRDDLENSNNMGEPENNRENVSKGYVFGPFAPISLSREANREQKKVRTDHDWQSLAASHRPHYLNQALRDLFGHYKEAWKSWYAEAAEK